MEFSETGDVLCKINPEKYHAIGKAAEKADINSFWRSMPIDEKRVLQIGPYCRMLTMDIEEETWDWSPCASHDAEVQPSEGKIRSLLLNRLLFFAQSICQEKAIISGKTEWMS